jgi:hypothetical protein
MSTRTRQHPRKHWCWTLNNPTVDEEQAIHSFATNDLCEYMCYQHEVGERGTYHLQGYVGLSKKRRWNSLHQWFSPRTHFEESRGTPQQNFRYCTKLETRATLLQWSQHFETLPLYDGNVGPLSLENSQLERERELILTRRVKLLLMVEDSQM